MGEGSRDKLVASITHYATHAIKSQIVYGETEREKERVGKQQKVL